MAITITVETGAVISNANSYISLNDFKAYCDQRDYDYSNSPDETIKAALVRAGAWLNTLSWSGVKTGRDNPMSWPRYGQEEGGNTWNQLQYPASAWVGVLDKDGFYIPTDEVPIEVINAQCEATWLILLGRDLEPVLERGGDVKKEVVDVIETEWFPGASAKTDFLPITNRLKGLLKSDGLLFKVRRA